MQPTTLHLPGYQPCKYKIVLTPHEELAKKIMEVQQRFVDKYKVTTTSVYRPQLILVTFTQLQALEEKIINRLRLIAMAYHPIKIELRNYGSYPSHTIFIEVISKNEVTPLVKKIREDAQRLIKLDNDNRPHFIMDANLTIARKLKPWQYENGWLEYSHLQFTGRFIAKNITLMRKRPGDERYTRLATFEFENMPIETKQGELF